MSMIADFQRLMQNADDEPASFASWSLKCQAARPRFDETQFLALMHSAHHALLEEVIARVHSQPPEFFETLVLDVLRSMGYGSKRRDMCQRIGRTGDGGIDGIIALDELGLDQVYMQAKRLRPGNPVPIGQVRDFAGSLEAKHASKGVFVTTTHFSPGAVEFCGQLSRRVVLIDGMLLAELMVRNNIGVTVKESFHFKRIDPSYFAMRTDDTISASIQPRR